MALGRTRNSLELEIQTAPENLSRQISNLGEDIEISGQYLEPADGGFAAWRLLLAAFVFEALLWGFPLSFGVFQNYYSQLPKFENHPYISVVGTVASGISYLGAPVVIPLNQRFSKYHRHMICFGCMRPSPFHPLSHLTSTVGPICILGLLAGSFATTLEALILTQGICYGLGFLIFYYPILSMVNEFWIIRRGMAYGLLCSASGVSGAVMPFAIEAMLNKYGYPTTLRAIAVGLVVLTGPLIPLLKGRLSPSGESIARKADWTFLKTPLFWIYSTSNVLQGLGYFFPSLYIPSYATSIGLSSTRGALLLAIMSVSQVLGQFSFGYLSDHRLSLNLLTGVSTLVSAAAVLALWGLARSFGILVVFSLVYGFFGAGYVAMWARMGTAISDEPSAAMATFSLFCFGKGVGNVLAGPLSAVLLSHITNSGGYGVTKYKAVVLFTGACMLLSAASMGLWYLKPRTLRAAWERIRLI